MTVLDAPWTKYLPPNTASIVAGWLAPYECRIVVKRPRRTKFGDFTPPRRGQTPAITINADLSPPRFLLTLTHEIAHLITWRNYGRRARPHGAQWKSAFSSLLQDLASSEALPDELRRAFSAHARAPKSTSSRDPDLSRVLRDLDGGDETWLDDLALGSEFVFHDRRFRKLTSDRTRCVCLDLNNRQKYRISKTAPVQPLEKASREAREI